MKTWSFFNPATGEFVSRTYSGIPDGLALNTPNGLEAFEGQVDFRKHRAEIYDLYLKDQFYPRRMVRLVDYEKPVDDRYVARRERAQIFGKLKALDEKQARPLAELLLDDKNEDARAKLVAIEAEKALLRIELSETETILSRP